MEAWINTITLIVLFAQCACVIGLWCLPKVEASLKITTQTVFLVSLIGFVFASPLLALGSTLMETRAYWYTGYCLLNAIAMGYVYVWHEREQTPITGLARLFFLNSMLHILLQIVRASEQLAWNTNYLKYMYKLGIPSLQIIMLLGLVLGVYTSFKLNQQSKEKKKWNS